MKIFVSHAEMACSHINSPVIVLLRQLLIIPNMPLVFFVSSDSFHPRIINVFDFLADNDIIVSESAKFYFHLGGILVRYSTSTF